MINIDHQIPSTILNTDISWVFIVPYLYKGTSLKSWNPNHVQPFLPCTPYLKKWDWKNVRESNLWDTYCNFFFHRERETRKGQIVFSRGFYNSWLVLQNTDLEFSHSVCNNVTFSTTVRLGLRDSRWDYCTFFYSPSYGVIHTSTRTSYTGLYTNQEPKEGCTVEDDVK